MKAFDQHEPPTEAELDRLGEFLGKCKGGEAMNIEELDGFFSALIAGPEVVLPSDYLRCSAGRCRILASLPSSMRTTTSWGS